MPLALSLAPTVQSNDATTIRFTDDTGTYDAGTNENGWGSPNELVDDIVALTTTTAAKVHITLDIVYTDSNLTEVTYDTIDLYSIAGPFTAVSDLVFDITPANLKVSGSAVGAVDDTLGDGWYVVTYSAYDAETSTLISSTAATILVDGVIRGLVYNALREVPFSHSFDRFTNNATEWDTLLTPLYIESLFQGMLAEVTTAKKTEILTLLGTLENLVSNYNLI
jgi:hypothetical protein